MAAHAKLSPSSAVRWMACPGSVALCADLPDDSSRYADEGTDAHQLAAMCLEGGDDEARQAKSYIGRTLDKGNTVTTEMALAVQDSVDYVLGVAQATGGQLLVEQRLPITDITGEADAHGTSDAVILAADELIVIDLKFGRGVAVGAEDNPQLQIYALAAYREFSLAQDFKTVRMAIHQPRLGAVSEWVQTVDELEDFAEQVSEAAAFTKYPDAHLNPTTKGCQFCKARATCPALAERVQEEVGASFESLTAFNREMTEATARKRPEGYDAERLGQAMAAVDLVEIWCNAVRAEAEARLLAGQHVPGFKLVRGKKGNRAWTSKEEAEEALKAMRIKHDQMYDYSVISPTTAEKLAKAEVIGPRQWPKLKALITQSDGKPSVAPESDKRPALVITATADDFQDETASLT